MEKVYITIDFWIFKVVCNLGHKILELYDALV